jgi:hypothetical protein
VSTPERKERIVEHLEKGDSAVLGLGKRFIAVETVQGKKGAEQYAHGYDTIRQACDALAEAVKQGALPEFVLDLDTGTKHDLDVNVSVTPQGVDARTVVLPRPHLRALIEDVEPYVRDEIAKRAMKRLRVAAK